ncbi:DUF397 domain-containing protein [Embleya sp. NBC_00896]|uniref:DUF397 domain-containing protein n=1 Tax=Embleya sp. NBC_00896 TaxID=2975961 RepID=UPI003862DE67|nr:DUF397 domain-containing protein [Embleya sp. NBC_00896]
MIKAVRPVPQWRKSSYSAVENQCVETAPIASSVGVRDSKDPARGHLELHPAAWSTLIGAIKHA